MQSNRFDLVFLNQVLEHIPNYEKVSNLLIEIRRILKPGGYACFIVPDYMFCQAHFYNSDPTHEFILTKRRMERLADYFKFVLLVNRVFCLTIRKAWFSPIIRFVGKLMLTLLSSSFVTMFFELTNQEKLLYKIQKQFMGNIVTIIQKPNDRF